MGVSHKALPVKLIFGFIFKEESAFNKALPSLERSFGKMDFQSQILDFSYTDYYQKELGFGLKKKFCSAKRLIDPSGLYKAKIITNKLEDKLSCSGARTINIDPGYLNLARLVLASTKDYYHRIYLNKGIFAELTLCFQKGEFRPLEWTYRDYRTSEYNAIFKEIRSIYARQIQDI